jgi:LysR family transcriptional regulator, hca operon transcriptional activator
LYELVGTVNLYDKTGKPLSQILARLELRHIRYFVAVAEELSFTRAANRLNISQPSLSRQIRDLELTLGGLLLERSKHQVKLTAAGRVFLREALRLLEQLHASVSATTEAMDAASHTITVGMSPVAELGLFPPLLPALKAEHPDLQLALRSLMPTEQVAALKRGEIQAGFFCLTPHAAAELQQYNLDIIPLYEEPYCVALPAVHRLSSCREFKLPSDFKGEAFIAVSTAKTAIVHDAMMSALAAVGVHPAIARDADNMMVALSMVSLGLGLALMPLCAISLRRDGVVYRPLRPRLTTPPLSLVLRREAAEPLTPLLLTVRRFTSRPSASYQDSLLGS